MQERWQKLEEIFHAAVELDGAEREGLLKDRCGDDDDMRAEIVALLNEHEDPSTSLESSVFDIGMRVLDERSVDERTGQSLGQFKIGRLIGRGGMGKIYAAEDAKQERQVAIKLLNEHFALDAERVRRFRKEARAVSRISHRNVAELYELCEIDGETLISMELVDGTNLRRRLHERLSVENALDIAIQIASGLAAAHAAGVVHRDIKPENIITTLKGDVKILDFGLAKLVSTSDGSVDIHGGQNVKATVDMSTEHGALIGTPAYMSPEQIRGAQVDAQTDIWSFGVLLYEMLSGELPFRGPTKIDMIAGILISTPAPIDDSNIPHLAELNTLVLKTLCKEKSGRYHSAEEVVDDLKKIRKMVGSKAQTFLTSELPGYRETEQLRSLRSPTNGDLGAKDLTEEYELHEPNGIHSRPPDRHPLRFLVPYRKKSLVMAILVIGIPLLSIPLILQLTKSPPQARLGDDAVADFSIASNPNGNWSYGFSPSNDITLFTLFTYVDDNTYFQYVPGMPVDAWRNQNSLQPLILHNTSDTVITAESVVVLSPDMLDLHPGKDGQRSVLRWTAPTTGVHEFEGRFEGIDINGTSSDVAVVHNSQSILFSENITGYGASKSFILTRQVVKGDTVDFSVGYGDNGYSSDSTGLSVAVYTISLAEFPAKEGPVDYWPGGRPGEDITEEWTRQFGTHGDDEAYGIAVTPTGNIYISGNTNGTLPGQTSSGNADAFVSKYDGAGNVVWTRQFGSSGLDFAYGVAVDAAGNIYTAGYTSGALPGQTSLGGADLFVRKYDHLGNEQWSRQFGTSSTDVALGIAVDADGNSFTAGWTDGILPGQTGSGGRDAFVRKYDTAGNEVWTQQFGSISTDEARRLAVDPTGNIYLSGNTDGTLAGQTSLGDRDAFVRKYDMAGNHVWTRQFGSANFDEALGIAVDRNGNIYAAGQSGGTFLGQTSSGNADAFVRKYDAAGNEIWTRQFGSSGEDVARGVAVDAAGNSYVVGWSGGTLPGQTRAGPQDAFLRKYDAAGSEVWTRQFGSSGTDLVLSVAGDAAGKIYITGRVSGTLPGQTSRGGSDGFVRKYFERRSGIQGLDAHDRDGESAWHPPTSHSRPRSSKLRQTGVISSCCMS